jgi:beta-glucanase (GH16 family)
MRDVRPTAPRDTARRAAAVVVALLVVTVLAACSGAPLGPLAPRAGSTTRTVLDESFDSGSLDSSVWNTCHWWADQGCTIASNDELEWYLPKQAKVADGALQLTAEERPVTGSDGKDYPYRSGMVTTGPPADGEPAKMAFTYGTVQVRFRAPEGRGLWPAIWLLPASQESRPEIDLLEMIGQDPAELIMHFHPEDRSADSPSKRYRLPGGATLADGWHTLRLDWTPGKLIFLLDDQQVWKVTGAQVPDEPMYLIMNLAVGGAYPGSPDSSTVFPSTFSIDDVHITTGA